MGSPCGAAARSIRGHQRDGGPACWCSGFQGPRVSSTGVEDPGVHRPVGGAWPLACSRRHCFADIDRLLKLIVSILLSDRPIGFATPGVINRVDSSAHEPRRWKAAARPLSLGVHLRHSLQGSLYRADRIECLPPATSVMNVAITG